MPEAAKKAAAAPKAGAGAPPPSIVEALALVMEQVRAVGKDSQAPGNIGGFRFRGVDAVVNAVAPALRAVGVVVMPEVLHVERVTTTSKSGNPILNVYVTTRFTFHGPAGDSLAAVVLGEASDSSDKATSKAQSVALRVALLQALMLPTDEPDPDSTNYERGAPQAQEENRPLSAAQVLANDMGQLAPALVSRIQAEWPFPGTHPTSLNDDQVAQVRAWITDLIANPPTAPATTGAPDPT